ncbi:MAG: sigma-70 family RNA polymerase sigma factor, partial [Candidatus Poribacteria bacterium]|nr:sigma-70 family RNA polymerase sigma factor [Candidatus Poribacteria bacterium]
QKVARIIEPIHDIDERRIIDTHPCPSHNIEQQELRHHLQEAVACLTPTRKRVFLLYYVHEMPIKAIAKQIGRSEGTIKTHLRNARLQLRERLTPYLKNQHIPWLA